MEVRGPPYLALLREDSGSPDQMFGATTVDLVVIVPSARHQALAKLAIHLGAIRLGTFLGACVRLGGFELHSRKNIVVPFRCLGGSILPAPFDKQCLERANTILNVRHSCGFNAAFCELADCDDQIGRNVSSCDERCDVNILVGLGAAFELIDNAKNIAFANAFSRQELVIHGLFQVGSG